MNVLLDSHLLDDLFQYLASVCWGDQYVHEDGMLNAVVSYLLTERDISKLLERYQKGHVSVLEELIAELYLDDRIVDTLRELVEEVRNNVIKQLGTNGFKNVKTLRGMIIVSLGEGDLC